MHNQMIDGKRPAFEALKLFVQRARTLTPNISGLLLQQRLMPAPQTSRTADDDASSPRSTAAVSALVHAQEQATDGRAQLREVASTVGGSDGGFAGMWFWE